MSLWQSSRQLLYSIYPTLHNQFIAQIDEVYSNLPKGHRKPYATITYIKFKSLCCSCGARIDPVDTASVCQRLVVASKCMT